MAEYPRRFRRRIGLPALLPPASPWWHPLGIERGFMSRASSVTLTLVTLRFFWNSSHGPESDATGYQGFYYHFLDMRTGRRAWQRELSEVLLAAGPAGRQP